MKVTIESAKKFIVRKYYNPGERPRLKVKIVPGEVGPYLSAGVWHVGESFLPAATRGK